MYGCMATIGVQIPKTNNILNPTSKIPSCSLVPTLDYELRTSSNFYRDWKRYGSMVTIQVQTSNIYILNSTSKIPSCSSVHFPPPKSLIFFVIPLDTQQPFLFVYPILVRLRFPRTYDVTKSTLEFFRALKKNFLKKLR